MEGQHIDTVTADQFLSRAIDFIHGSGTLCSNVSQGWLSSSVLLISQAFELLAKRRLLLQGKTKEVLRRSPYGHDLHHLCGHETGLRDEAKTIAQDFLKRPSPNGVNVGFEFDVHFDAMADAHSTDGKYSVRYHEGVRSFANPKAMRVILNEIARRDRMR